MAGKSSSAAAAASAAADASSSGGGGGKTVHARAVDVAALELGEVRSENGRVSVPLAQAPLSVLTGSSVLVNGPVDSEFVPVPFLHVKFVSPADRRFFESFEKLVLETALSRRAEWFGKKVDADHIRASFKSFLRDGALKVRLPPEVAAFDAGGAAADVAEFFPGDSARLLLEASAVRLGRNEFGCVWTLKQLRRDPKVACLIDTSGGASDDDSEFECFV